MWRGWNKTPWGWRIFSTKPDESSILPKKRDYMQPVLRYSCSAWSQYAEPACYPIEGINYQMDGKREKWALFLEDQWIAARNFTVCHICSLHFVPVLNILYSFTILSTCSSYGAVQPGISFSCLDFTWRIALALFPNSICSDFSSLNQNQTNRKAKSVKGFHH